MIKTLIASFRVIGRVLKNIFLRPFRTASARIRELIGGRQLVSAVPDMVKKLPEILRTKPEKREDYFDWGSIYIAKSLVLIGAALVIALPLLYLFLLHPILVGWFWVRDFHADDVLLSSYTGKVRVYYDENFERIQFEGRLENGKADGGGSEYYENGGYRFVGEFARGTYEGEGILYYEDGSVEYRGGFADGRFEGVGEYAGENGRVYSGVFENGAITGYGTLTVGGGKYYEGNFSHGVIEGEGKMFRSDGAVRYDGSFTDGEPNGTALEYYPDGTIKYNGAFAAGLYSGTGVLYSESGKKRYAGSFEMGVYSGMGTLYGEDGERLYTGEFENGQYSGSGTLYGSDGSVTAGSFSDGEIVGAAVRTFVNGTRYEGCFSDHRMNGSGSLSDVTGGFTYSGAFLDDDFDYTGLIGAEPSAVRVIMPSLVQTVAENCFYLNDQSFGIAVRCSFASDGVSAAVVEVFERPISGAAVIISRASDIHAPHASSVSESEGEPLPLWAAEEFGIIAGSVDCYTALYEGIAVNFWTDRATGRLLLKSAKSVSEVPGTGGKSTSESGTLALSAEEIVKLLEELGLDVADFESLGLSA